VLLQLERLLSPAMDTEEKAKYAQTLIDFYRQCPKGKVNYALTPLFSFIVERLF
jgi:hypothetical protein